MKKQKKFNIYEGKEKIKKFMRNLVKIMLTNLKSVVKL